MSPVSEAHTPPQLSSVGQQPQADPFSLCRVPRATKASWERWASLETLGPLAPQVLKGPGAP